MVVRDNEGEVSSNRVIEGEGEASTGVQDEQTGIAAEVYPNPANTVVRLRFTNESPAAARLRIVEATGKSVFEAGVEANEGTHELTLPVESFPPGIYTVIFGGMRLPFVITR